MVGFAVATLAATVSIAVGSGATASPTTIKVVQNKTWGPTLALKDGATVYRLAKDSKDKSMCSGTCVTIWKPVVLAAGQAKPVGVGVSNLGSFVRAGGAHQVTYEGIPLYTFTKDPSAGAVTGNIKDTWGQWWSINPSSPLTPPKKKSSGGGGAPTTTTTAPGGVVY
jgi:predicted lipoprotein with Yx(FWY)xxD motif